MKSHSKKIIPIIKSQISSKFFIHNEWYEKYHINVVLKIAIEITEEEGFVFNDDMRTIVWMHDYGKIFLCDKEYEKYYKFLYSISLSKKWSRKIVSSIKEIDQKNRLNESDIVVKIISTADGISHIITPFYMFFWRENSTEKIDYILKENRRKLDIDWNKKIVMEKYKKRYLHHYLSLKQQFSEIKL